MKSILYSMAILLIGVTSLGWKNESLQRLPQPPGPEVSSRQFSENVQDPAVHKEPAEGIAPVQNSDQSDPRINELERRVARLENLLFNAVRLAEFDAERRLADAQTRLDNSERLFLQGFITDAQVAQDRFVFDRAIRELQLAQSNYSGRQIACEIEVMQAKRNLELAQQQLEFSERLNLRGYSSLDRIQSEQRRVDTLTLELDQAQAKLRAVNELLQVEPEQPKPEIDHAPDGNFP